MVERKANDFLEDEFTPSADDGDDVAAVIARVACLGVHRHVVAVTPYAAAPNPRVHRLAGVATVCSHCLDY
jgi:hypothetical protein